MGQVAKLVIIDQDGQHLLMYRNSHPTYGNDPDLPGGTLEKDESPLAAMAREVQEEAGITVDQEQVDEVYSGTSYSEHGANYLLFVAKLHSRPEIVLSWEHASY